MLNKSIMCPIPISKDFYANIFFLIFTIKCIFKPQEKTKMAIS